MEDIFDNGTPKYQRPQDIYDAVQAMASGEEIGILSQMFSDVSWENQDYYYADAGAKLQERWETMTDYGDKMWPMDAAAWQMEESDANEWFFEILNNDDLAKRIGWKKMFTDIALSGIKGYYDKAVEEFRYQLGELNRWDFTSNAGALGAALEECGFSGSHILHRKIYNDLCSAVYKKLKGLKLEGERQLIAESRAMLTAYDDFMFGLRSNQALYSQQEIMYQKRVAQLKENYENAVRELLNEAQAQGVVLTLPDEKMKLEAHNGT